MGLRRCVSWVLEHRKTVTGWAVRIASFYVGVRVLQHEIYQTETSEPLLLLLGLWLCGLAPAKVLDRIGWTEPREKNVESPESSPP